MEVTTNTNLHTGLKSECDLRLTDSLKLSATIAQKNQVMSPSCDADFDYAQLDPGIAMAVRVLREAGVETIWSCEGGEGHAYSRPTVEFWGNTAEVQRVVELAREARLGPWSVQRCWRLANERFPESLLNGLDLPAQWKITFEYKFPLAT